MLQGGCGGGGGGGRWGQDGVSEEADYSVLRKLGQGSFGQTWLSTHLPSSRLVCLKAIDVDQDDGRTSSQEIAILAQLCHPNCVRYLGSFRTAADASLVIVMEFCDGGDLAERIKAQARATVPFSEHQVLRWFSQLCLGLQHMHSLRILHRDLKPQNVFLRRHPLGDRLVLGDVGISKALISTLDQAQTAIGTPAYLAPEVFNRSPYAFPADVWSLGCILFELANLKQAFSSPYGLSDLAARITQGRLAATRPGLSTAMLDHIQDVLQVNPSRRPSLTSLLDSAIVRPHVQAYAAQVLAEAAPTTDDTGAADAAGRTALRRQLEECGLGLGELSAEQAGREASGGGIGPEEERRLQAVLARLRQEREARLAAPPPPRGRRRPSTPLASALPPTRATESSATIDSAAATADAAMRRLRLSEEEASQCMTPPGASPFASPTVSAHPSPCAPPQEPPPRSPSLPTTLAQRVHESRAFLSRALGEEALRRAYALVVEDHGNSKEQGEEDALSDAEEVFAGPRAKYRGMFLHLVAMEEQLRCGRG